MIIQPILYHVNNLNKFFTKDVVFLNCVQFKTVANYDII